MFGIVLNLVVIIGIVGSADVIGNRRGGTLHHRHERHNQSETCAVAFGVAGGNIAAKEVGEFLAEV